MPARWAVERAKGVFQSQWEQGLAQEGVMLQKRDEDAPEAAICPACGTELSDDVDECPDCGLFVGG